MKKTIPLNDNWLYIDEFKPEFIKNAPELGVCRAVSLPHSGGPSDLSYFDEKTLRRAATYFRYLNVDKKYAGSRVMCKFGGVLSYAEVYVNGVFVTSHKGETPFDADITVPLKIGEENIILVKADSTLRKDVPSRSLSGSDLIYGGIFRDVFLEINKGEVISDAFVTCSGFDGAEKQVRIDVGLYSFFPDTTLKADILDSSGNVVGTIPEKDVLRENAVIKGSVSAPELWETENPVLYTAKIVLSKDGKTLDERCVNFGFRTAVFTRGGFYLNGRKVKLIGLNRFDSYPFIGRAAPALLERGDANILKRDLGCNVVRCHGLPSRDFVEECDRLGLMIISDLSGDGYLGSGEWRDSLVNTVSETVRRDRNSPSVIAWGVRVNNSADFDELYFKTNKAARDLDGTRQTLGARSFMGSRLYEDVFAYNDYSKKGISRLVKTCRLFVPYIISEHTGKNCPVKPFDGEKVKLEQAMRHLRVIDKVLGKDNICGAVGMSFTDFYTAAHKGGGDNINYYGVLDIYRNEKFAAYAYASQFCKKPVLELSSNLAPDEFTGKLYAFTNCDYIKVYRGGKEIGQYAPDKRNFKNLPHPPVLIKDLTGITGAFDGIKPTEARLLKYLIKRTEKKGALNLGRIDKFILYLLTKKLKFEADEMRSLLKKCSLNADESRPLTVEGYIDGVCVLTRRTGTGGNVSVTVKCAAEKILCGKSYELVKVDIEARDGQDNIADKYFEPVRVSAEGAFRVEGRDSFSLIAGRGSFFLRAAESGSGVVRVECCGETHEFALEAEYEQVERF